MRCLYNSSGAPAIQAGDLYENKLISPRSCYVKKMNFNSISVDLRLK